MLPILPECAVARQGIVAVSAGFRDRLHRAMPALPFLPLFAGAWIAALERRRWVGAD